MLLKDLLTYLLTYYLPTYYQWPVAAKGAVTP